VQPGQLIQAQLQCGHLWGPERQHSGFDGQTAAPPLFPDICLDRCYGRPQIVDFFPQLVPTPLLERRFSDFQRYEMVEHRLAFLSSVTPRTSSGELSVEIQSLLVG